uniref:Uncharacterized protein n=1 Tax=Physcomitrium patens TaxID=3218 RepID=A0A2K1IQ67_PHYPA|nr:hypothetical protein PHYPA_025538 [Physcomitrium patens]
MVAPLAQNHEAVGGWSLIDGACEHLMRRFQQSGDYGLRGASTLVDSLWSAYDSVVVDGVAEIAV